MGNYIAFFQKADLLLCHFDQREKSFTRSLSENRRPTAEKPILASFSDHFRYTRKLFNLNDRKN